MTATENLIEALETVQLVYWTAQLLHPEGLVDPEQTTVGPQPWSSGNKMAPEKVKLRHQITDVWPPGQTMVRHSEIVPYCGMSL